MGREEGRDGEEGVDREINGGRKDGRRGGGDAIRMRYAEREREPSGVTKHEWDNRAEVGEKRKLRWGEPNWKWHRMRVRRWRYWMIRYRQRDRRYPTLEKMEITDRQRELCPVPWQCDSWGTAWWAAQFLIRTHTHTHTHTHTVQQVLSVRYSYVIL